MNIRKQKTKLIAAAISALLAELLVPSFSGVAHAFPQFTNAVMRWDTHQGTTGISLITSGVSVCIVPSSTITVPASTWYTVQIVFPVAPAGIDFDYDATAANWVTDTDVDQGGGIVPDISDDPGVPDNFLTTNDWPNIDTAANSVTVPALPNDPNDPGIVDFRFGNGVGVTTLTSGLLYCFHFDGGLTNSGPVPTMDGTVRILDNNPTVLQESNYATTILDNDAIVGGIVTQSGQPGTGNINVSAIVPPNLKFTLQDNVDTFGRLDTATLNSSAGVWFRVETNAKGGWVAWVKDTDRSGDAPPKQGLRSATANYTIGPQDTVDGVPSDLLDAGGEEDYVLDADTDLSPGCSGALMVAPEYDADMVLNVNVRQAGGTISNLFQPVAFCSGVAPATSDGDTITLTERANIRGGTPAGTDYADVITVIAAGNF